MLQVALLRNRDILHDKLDYVYGYEPGISLRARNKVGEDTGAKSWKACTLRSSYFISSEKEFGADSTIISFSPYKINI